MSDNRRYYLVMYDVNQAKGIAGAMKKTLNKKDADVILQDANATITTDKGKFTVVEKRMFEMTDVIAEQTGKTLYIICDVTRKL